MGQKDGEKWTAAVELQPAHPQVRQAPSGTLGVQLSAARCAGVYLLSTWMDAAAALEQGLRDGLGSVPTRPGALVQTALGLLMRTGPQEFLLITPDTTGPAPTSLEQLRTLVPAQLGAVVDLSHARCRIRITGPACTQVLGKLFALDVRESGFAVNEVRHASTHHVPSLLHRTGAQAFDWYVMTTYAHDQLGTLLDAALEYGYHLARID